VNGRAGGDEARAAAARARGRGAAAGPRAPAARGRAAGMEAGGGAARVGCVCGGGGDGARAGRAAQHCAGSAPGRAPRRLPQWRRRGRGAAAPADRPAPPGGRVSAGRGRRGGRALVTGWRRNAESFPVAAGRAQPRACPPPRPCPPTAASATWGRLPKNKRGAPGSHARAPAPARARRAVTRPPSPPPARQSRRPPRAARTAGRPEARTPRAAPGSRPRPRTRRRPSPGTRDNRHRRRPTGADPASSCVHSPRPLSRPHLDPLTLAKPPLAPAFSLSALSAAAS